MAFWTVDEVQVLRGWDGVQITPQMVAAAFGERHNIEGARNKMISLGLTATVRRVEQGQRAATLARVISDTPERKVLAPEESEEEPIGELKARAIRATSRAVDKVRSQRFAAVNVVTNGPPIGVCFASDQHFSTGEPVDVQKAFADAETIQQTPGLFVVLGGDGADNHIKHRAALVNRRSSPSDEWRLYDHYLGTLGNKLLTVISGNHDDWTKHFAGIDMVSWLSKRHAVHYSPDECVLTLRLLGRAPRPGEEPAGQEYTAKVRHKYRFNSALNVGHVVKRMYDMGGDIFDVGVVCHNHEPHIESFERHGSTRWALRPGSYQVQTSYGRSEGYNDTYPTCPMVVFWPGEKKMVAFRDLREGVEALALYREAAGAGELQAAA